MAEEFRAAVCSRSWWMPPRTTFNRSSCSSITAEMENVGPFWPKELMDMKSKSSDESSDGSMIFQDIQQLSGGTTTMSPDFAVQMRATAFSNSSATTTTDWDQNLFFKLHEGTFSTSGDGSTAMIEADHQGFTVDQQQSLSFATSSNDCTTFPIRSTSYGYPSSLVQSLFISNSPPPSPPPPPQQQPFCDFQLNSNNFSFVQNMPKRQVPDSFHLTNNTPFWNASASPLDHNISCFSLSRSSQFLPSSYKEKESLPNLSIKPNLKEIRDSGSIAKNSHDELPVKQRLETPSPLPTFKVRKEKLGDRITALQQLVSPFGKTDTASVLHEAIEYIKLLHDQVNILSAPYMKKGAPKQLLPICDEVKGVEGHKQDLRSLGLCLVPVPSRFPVATEMATRFWTPSYEGSFR